MVRRRAYDRSLKSGSSLNRASMTEVEPTEENKDTIGENTEQPTQIKAASRPSSYFSTCRNRTAGRHFYGPVIILHAVAFRPNAPGRGQLHALLG